MATRSTYTAPQTPSTPSFQLPAPHARASLDVDAIHSPLLTPVEETPRSLGDNYTKTKWQRCRQSIVDFGAKNTGLLLVIASQAFYGAMNVFVKVLNKLDPPVPPLELIFVRMIITYVCCTSYMLINKVPHPFLGPPGVRRLLIFRGFSGFFGLFGVYFSLQYLSLSDATVITFLAPTCTAIAGAVLLKEKLRVAELWAALVSLLGVILIARPAFIFGHSTASDGAENGVTPAQRFAAVCVALFGVLGATGAYVSIRAIGHRAHAMHSLTSFSSTCVIAASLLSLLPSTATLPTEWTIPSSREHILLMFLIGALGFVAQALMTTGLQRETAGRGSMGMYAQIVFAGLYDTLVFHTRMNALSMTGTVLIVSSALYVAVTKKVTKAPTSETAKIEAAEAGAATEEEGLLSAAEPTGGADRASEPTAVSMGSVSREGTMRGPPQGFAADA